MIRRRPRSTLFPCTQHFRSDDIIGQWGRVRPGLDVSAMQVFGRLHRSFLLYRSAIGERLTEGGTIEPGVDVLAASSEEDTSELQSRQYVACRLLRAKKQHSS